MRIRGALVGAIALVVTCAPVADMAAATPRPAPQLLARVTRVNDGLALLGQTPGPFGLPRESRVLELRFTNRDGYAMTVIAVGQTVALSVSNGHKDRRGNPATRSSTTTYLSHGKVTPTSVRASFADRGRIAVRFRPSGQQIHASKKAGCKRSSSRAIADLGVFVGELRFQGEGAYTSAEVHRVHGGSVHLDALFACMLGSRPERHGLTPASEFPAFGPVARPYIAARGPQSVPTHPSGGSRRTTLLADLKLPLSQTLFGAQVRGSDQPRFVALEAGSEGSIGVIRIVSTPGSKSSFAFEDTLAGAVVAPPAPFHGRGELVKGLGGAESWTGSLAVSFLGAPGVPLTGAPFRVQLAQSLVAPAGPGSF